jgi:hypothetical protein
MKQATLMRRSTVLNLPLQLVVPGLIFRVFYEIMTNLRTQPSTKLHLRRRLCSLFAAIADHSVFLCIILYGRAKIEDRIIAVLTFLGTN